MPLVRGGYRWSERSAAIETTVPFDAPLPTSWGEGAEAGEGPAQQRLLRNYSRSRPESGPPSLALSPDDEDEEERFERSCVP